MSACPVCNGWKPKPWASFCQPFYDRLPPAIRTRLDAVHRAAMDPKPEGWSQRQSGYQSVREQAATWLRNNPVQSYPVPEAYPEACKKEA